MTMAAPVERKVKAATAAAYVGCASLLGALTAVEDDGRLVGWMPAGLALVPTAITAVSGWMARHTPRGSANGGG